MYTPEKYANSVVDYPRSDNPCKLFKKEYKTLYSGKPTIGLLLMLKNESARLSVTLNSVIGAVDALIVFDTGSTDNTVDIVKNFCELQKINLYLIEGEFIDFSTSRNVSLDFADTVNVMYLLLMDCNDELQGPTNDVKAGPTKLREFAKRASEKETSGFLVCQKWWSGQHDKYFNIRIVKNNHGWRYFGSVHEWMKDTTRAGPEPAHQVMRLPDEIVLFQDRTLDNNKSGARFSRDRILLLEEFKKNPKDPRTLFYLAQTCECLNNREEALYYSKLRLEEKGFEEEIFHSYMRCGNCCVLLSHDWSDSMKWYMKAYEFSNRAEPLVKIANHYREQQKWHVAYTFIRQACELTYPEHLILFVDSGCYDYMRWHIMGIVGYYVGRLSEGKSACMKAIEKGINKELNQRNLEFYTQAEEKVGPISVYNWNNSNSVQNSVSVPVKKDCKREFINKKVVELKEMYPKLPIKNLHSKASKMWKDEKKK